ncbi:GIY-YIG nuclease family protein [Paraburkholderia sp. EG287A]|uniref:GIY-YIG nuclease family protein n=1 Tax=Paraburkholderia sp. EG287A TaxID=3237012 RepID=UPI0034D191ED
MNRLLDIGFQVAGNWRLEGGRARIDIHKHGTQNNVLYAFVRDGLEVMYVGTSTMTLRARMAGYASPGSAKRTNLRVNQLIQALLAEGSVVELYVLPDNGLMHYGPFHLNLAAGLEGSIIRTLGPEWNVMFGRKREDAQANPSAGNEEVGAGDEDVEAEEEAPPAGVPAVQPSVVGRFRFKLQPTYWKQGFFNGGIDSTQLLGSDGETVEIFFGDEARPITGTINRTCNANGSPRIFGGPELRSRFQTLGELTLVRVDVFSPTSIRLCVDDSPS